jgi:hypothetical protein
MEPLFTAYLILSDPVLNYTICMLRLHIISSLAAKCFEIKNMGQYMKGGQQ